MYPHSKQYEDDKSDQLKGQAAGDQVNGFLLLVRTSVGHCHRSHDLQNNTSDIDEDIDLRNPGDPNDREFRRFQRARHPREGHVNRSRKEWHRDNQKEELDQVWCAQAAVVVCPGAAVVASCFGCESVNIWYRS